MNSKEHWESIYSRKRLDELSWYQATPALSLDLIKGLKLPPSARIIDVGGGSSALAGQLAEAGFSDVTVLDIAVAALRQGKERVGPLSQKLAWTEADVLRFKPAQPYDLWHDRAVFHFLNSDGDQKMYLESLDRGLKPGGYLVIAGFAEDGPEKCSNLPVKRYSLDDLKKLFSPKMKFLASASEMHRTPWDTQQHFNYAVFQKR